MTRRLVMLLGLTTLLAAPAAAQVPVLDVRLGAQVAAPLGDLGDAYSGGFGVYGRVGAPIGPLKLMASATWTRLKGKSVTILGVPVGVPDADVISLQAGPHFSLAMLDVGIEGAYYTEFKEMGFAPNVSIGLLNFEVTASYNMVLTDPSSTWLSIGGGFRF